MNPAISNPFFFSSFGTVTHVNEEEKTAAVAMEDKSGFCLVRYQQADSLKKGDILDLGSRKPGTNSDIFNQTQHKKNNRAHPADQYGGFPVKEILLEAAAIRVYTSYQSTSV